MKPIHVPRIDARYWLAITLASVFGTNMGDLYAHDSGLGIVRGLAVLAAGVAVLFAVERFDQLKHQFYYWAVIIVIRTGATNIADYLAFKVRVNPVALTLGLAAIIAIGAWWSASRMTQREADASLEKLPQTDVPYWIAMLGAGVFGTVVGDICQHVFGQGTASIGLTALLGLALLLRYKSGANAIMLYWTTVAVARTAGTAVGDWLAEDKILNLGLPIATLISGCAFCAVLLLWRSRRGPPTAATSAR